MSSTGHVCCMPLLYNDKDDSNGNMIYRAPVCRGTSYLSSAVCRTVIFPVHSHCYSLPNCADCLLMQLSNDRTCNIIRNS